MVMAFAVKEEAKAVARVKLTVTAGVPTVEYTAFGVVAVINQDVKVTWPPREPADAAGLTWSRVDWTVTAPDAEHAPVSNLGAPVAMLLKVHDLSVVSHGLVKLRTNVVAAIATVAVGATLPPVHTTVGTVFPTKNPIG
jgi:hypothetical protein